MKDIRQRIARRMLKVSAQFLKYSSAILVVVVNANTVLLKKAVIGLDSYTQKSLVAAMDADAQLTGLVGLASILDVLAGLAVPVFAFLLAEGFAHTSNYGEYLKRVAATAVVSEFAYDFAMTGRILEFSRQSPMLGVALCLIMLYFMGRTEEKPLVDRVVLQILLALCGLFWALALRAEYAAAMVLMTAVFYCLRAHRFPRLIAGLICSIQYVLGPMAFIPLTFYNGRRQLKCPSAVFYVLYPAHLLVLGIVGNYIL